ncbi:hypothetical protein AWB69_00636 [Caballeronia udeis]|uniref:Uncharacterized protein n=1 Tax=Caballeronia udeis TaxID=1232866 RepID=A0A158F528_9BURK|nr:hypothetical protein AWB69_00636 [Caballeronia udeis]
MIVWSRVRSEAVNASTKNKARRRNSPGFVDFPRRAKAIELN